MTNDEILKLIHEAIKEMRNDLNDNSERLASIETSLHALLGNGQPGEIQRMKEEIAKNTSFRNKALGALSLLGTINFASLAALLYQVFYHTQK